MEFFDADVVFTAEVADGLWGAGEVGGAVLDLQPTLGGEGVFGELDFFDEFVDLLFVVNGCDAVEVVAEEWDFGGWDFVFGEEVVGVGGGAFEGFCDF